MRTRKLGAPSRTVDGAVRSTRSHGHCRGCLGCWPHADSDSRKFLAVESGSKGHCGDARQYRWTYPNGRIVRSSSRRQALQWRTSCVAARERTAWGPAMTAWSASVPSLGKSAAELPDDLTLSRSLRTIRRPCAREPSHRVRTDSTCRPPTR